MKEKIKKLILLFFLFFIFFNKELMADYYPSDGICMERPFTLIGKVKPSYYSEINLRFPSLEHYAWEYNFSTCDPSTNTCYLKPTPADNASGSEFIMQLKTKIEDPYAGNNPTAYVLEIAPQDYFIFNSYKICYMTTNCSTASKPMAQLPDGSYYTPYSLTEIPLNTLPFLTPAPNTTPFAYVEYTVLPKLPNCKNIVCNNNPTLSNILIGDQLTCSVDFEKDQQTNTLFSSGRLFAYFVSNNTCNNLEVNPEIKTCAPPCNSTAENFTFYPQEEGVYYLHCSAVSPNNFACIGQASDPSTPTERQCIDYFTPPCRGPNASKSISAILPNPWYKLKNTSLNKYDNHNISVVQNIKKFTDADQDDNNTRQVIIGETGILLSENDYNPGPSYNPIPVSTINSKNWYGEDYGDFSSTSITNLIQTFISYAKSRKKTKIINNVLEIEKNTINIIDNNLTLNNEINNNAPFVLIVNGDLIINLNNFNSNSSSIAIIANNITFSNQVQFANGIFIANQINYQNNTNGLKVIGNLISKNSITLQSRSDSQYNERPSLFVVFSPKMYLDLLPYLSISKYDYQQIQ